MSCKSFALSETKTLTRQFFSPNVKLTTSTKITYLQLFCFYEASLSYLCKKLSVYCWCKIEDRFRAVMWNGPIIAQMKTWNASKIVCLNISTSIGIILSWSITDVKKNLSEGSVKIVKYDKTVIMIKFLFPLGAVERRPVTIFLRLSTLGCLFCLQVRPITNCKLLIFLFHLGTRREDWWKHPTDESHCRNKGEL